MPNFFRKIFKKKTKHEIDNETLTQRTFSKDDFIDELKNKYSPTQEEKNERLFKLFREGKITEEELTDEQKEIVSKLYIKYIQKEASKVKKLLEKFKNT